MSLHHLTLATEDLPSLHQTGIVITGHLCFNRAAGMNTVSMREFAGGQRTLMGLKLPFSKWAVYNDYNALKFEVYFFVRSS